MESNLLMTIFLFLYESFSLFYNNFFFLMFWGLAMGLVLGIL